MLRAPFALPLLRTDIPGPISRDLALRLARVESQNITAVTPHPPIFWKDAWNANVSDVDDNIYIDLTSGFGVALAGHSNEKVAAAIAAQARSLSHGMGDVYPPAIKVELLERLASIAPGDLSVSILASDGATAVEAALKTAVMKTGRSAILAFEGAYHGLTYGALATTWRSDFRAPFLKQLNPHVHFAPFPAGQPDPEPGSLERTMDAVERIIAQAESDGDPIGAIIVEPIQGRGGIVVPPPEFLPALRRLCDGERTLLIFDEVYTGMGRTGRWFVADSNGVVPDLLVIGKALTGSIAMSAAIGTPSVMGAWPPSHGEAIHTSTFLGNPIACAAALAQISEIEDLVNTRLGGVAAILASRLERWVTSRLIVARRGAGLMQAIRLDGPQRGPALMTEALRRGVLVLPEGDGSIVAITPPGCISDEQLEHALDVLEGVLETGRGESLRGV